jgi:hypothetical protein
MTDQCSTCIFYVAGSCRESKPVNVMANNSSGACVPPLVTPDYWCGDGISTIDGHLFSPKVQTGPTGAAGTQWSFGMPVPTGGADGDWYLQQYTTHNSFTVWTKISGAWTPVAQSTNPLV